MINVTFANNMKKCKQDIYKLIQVEYRSRIDNDSSKIIGGKIMDTYKEKFNKCLFKRK